jgi:DNA-binding CsgD family transcriptional regulator
VPTRLPRVLRAIAIASDPDEVLKAMHTSVTLNHHKLDALAVWRFNRLVRPPNFDVFWHPNVPQAFRDQHRALLATHGPSLLSRIAATGPLPFTFSEARAQAQPRGADSWVFDFLEQHNYRDGLYCAHGTWMGVYGSRRILHRTSALNHETRMVLDAVASIAIYRIKGIVTAKTKLLGTTIDLSPREVTVLRHISEGKEIATIATRLNLTETSVRTYLLRAQHKLQAKNPAHAVALALQQRLI